MNYFILSYLQQNSCLLTTEIAMVLVSLTVSWILRETRAASLDTCFITTTDSTKKLEQLKTAASVVPLTVS
ncbi:hypothetical protein [uncultured Gimesia sp.]|uniref:hypothetical protein n=1 Tax=uncultured Gimesia sp. TaxID=1678688 RepID=UPI0030DBB658|tara:strand:+ start:412303 stop:412515 length:213 start_codon:yes stop_codon:yes gene_type:complete